VAKNTTKLIAADLLFFEKKGLHDERLKIRMKYKDIILQYSTTNVQYIKHVVVMKLSNTESFLKNATVQ
jgi:hypothetical protein